MDANIRGKIWKRGELAITKKHGRNGGSERKVRNDEDNDARNGIERVYSSEVR
jgi:hypothetical protein